jgi:hypothetical protein
VSKCLFEFFYFIFIFIFISLYFCFHSNSNMEGGLFLFASIFYVLPLNVLFE